MKRRSAIKGLSALAIGVALFPSCSDGLALDTTLPDGLHFTDEQSIWIEAISDAILPKDGLSLTTYETFQQFVSKMVPFENSEGTLKAFVDGYNHCTNDIKELNQNSVDNVSAEAIIEYFGAVLEPSDETKERSIEDKQIQIHKMLFCKELRNLSMRHLISSKEYQEDVLEYKLVPGFYDACVPV